MKLILKDREGKIHRIVDNTNKETRGKCQDASELSDDEIALLKKLVPHIEELITLLEVEKDEHDSDFDGEDIDEQVTEESFEAEGELTEDEETVEDDVVDEEETVEKIHDSKKSFGSIERKNVTDSVDDEISNDQEIAIAWAKRYGGK